MDYNIKDVTQFIEEHDVKFIRLAFCDIFGTQKNISIMPTELPKAFEHGISFDASGVKGFMQEGRSDLLLFPDPDTLSILPWRPSTGRVVRFFCHIRYPDGTPFEGDCRRFLRGAVQQMQKETGLTPQIGTESEFSLFKLDEFGNPTSIPSDHAGYLDIAPLDKGENLRREICLTLEQMGIMPETSHHEKGPGQHEIDFKHSGALRAADNLVTFKSVVSTIAAQYGSHASFEPKPMAGTNGNGLHINVSLYKRDENVFSIDTDAGSPGAGESFTAGILAHTAEMTLFLNPSEASYKRFGEFEAPKYVTWSHQNRSQLIRVPSVTSADSPRMELRSPDSTCNPYIAFGLLIYAGLEGVQNNLRLPPPMNVTLFDADEQVTRRLQPLPSSLEEAAQAANASAFIRRVIPARILENYSK